MAGRGRGRQASSLTQEQLQVLGCVGKDMPSVPTAPPPTFPPLLSKPVPLTVSNALTYQILWKEDFGSYMRDSPYFLIPKTLKNSIQRYSDQCVSILENSKEKQKAEIPWQLMPSELRATSHKRKAKTKVQPKKYKRIETFEDHLKRLEEKEKTDLDVEDKNQKNSDSDDEEEEETKQEIEEDDEMDEDNDYGNNYFDNGEAFNEEDDNLDDGPVY